jgi:hypothetical protein
MWFIPNICASQTPPRGLKRIVLTRRIRASAGIKNIQSYIDIAGQGAGVTLRQKLLNTTFTPLEGEVGDVFIFQKAFDNLDLLKATIAHEAGHSVRALQGNHVKKDATGWNFDDGVDGYINEFNYAGKMHINSKVLSQLSPTSPNQFWMFPSKINGKFISFTGKEPLNPLWYSGNQYIKHKWQLTLPRR